MPAKTMNPSKTTAAKPAQDSAKPARESAGKRAAASPPRSEEQIRQLAYQKWEAAGKPLGDGLHYWLEAERELCPA